MEGRGPDTVAEGPGIAARPLISRKEIMMSNENAAPIIEWHEGSMVDDGTGTRPGEGGTTYNAPWVEIHRDGETLATGQLRDGEDEEDAQSYRDAEDRALAEAGLTRADIAETITPW